LLQERIKSNYSTNRKGVRIPLIAYLTKHTHSSVIKGLKVAGIGEENIHYIDTDKFYAMDVANLEEQIEIDISKGLIPFLFVPQ